MTWLILVITDKVVGLKVTEADEETGLDVSEHGEGGYGLPFPVPAMAAATGNGDGGDPGQLVVPAED